MDFYTDTGVPLHTSTTSQKVLTIVLVVWTIAGLFAIIDSLFCMGRSGGDISQKVSGALLAFLFGPVYWVYKHVMRRDEGYCVSEGRNK